jgi:chemotaxis protein histidine kinase CheA
MTHPSGSIGATAGAARVPSRLFDFFRREAEEYVKQLGNVLGRSTEPDQVAKRELLSLTRALRGSATMVRCTPLADLVAAMERIARSLQSGRLPWSVSLRETLRSTVSQLGPLVAAARNWSAEAGERARALGADLAQFAGPPPARSAAGAVPVAQLFHSDSGPHVLYVAATPQTQFEQQLRELATSTDTATLAADQAGAPPAATWRPDGRMTPSAAARALEWRPPTGSPTPAAASRTTPAQPPAPRRTPPARGQELRALLDVSVSQLSGSFTQTEIATELVPIEALLYRGEAALARAQEIGRALRERGAPASPEETAEILDLIELASRP